MKQTEKTNNYILVVNYSRPNDYDFGFWGDADSDRYLFSICFDEEDVIKKTNSIIRRMVNEMLIDENGKLPQEIINLPESNYYEDYEFEEPIDCLRGSYTGWRVDDELPFAYRWHLFHYTKMNQSLLL